MFLCSVNLPTTQTTKKVAVKLIFNNSNSTNTVLSKYENEYVLLTNLEFHMNIISVWHHFAGKPTDAMVNLLPESAKTVISKYNPRVKRNEVSTTHFIVMEVLDSFKDYLETHEDLTPKQCIWFCVEICSALKFLWEKKIVHRDLKLDNILLSFAQYPVLCDFGCADKTDESGCIKQPPSVGGNKGHLAPEVLNSWANKTPIINYSKQPSWELGIICYEIATLTHPFDGYPPLHGPVSVTKLDTTLLEKLNYPEAFIKLVENLVDNDFTKRMELSEAFDKLQSLHKE